MTSEIIEKFIENTSRKSSIVNIHFKERSTVKGMFIRSSDFDELKMKNLWRVVSNEKIEETIADFGKVVDQIENKSFTPHSPGHLETRIEGTTRKFATQVCRNCDARFSCGSLKRYCLKLTE